MKRVILAGIVAVCIASTSVFAAEVKLGYIDMQRVMGGSEAGKEAKEQVAAKTKAYQADINIKQEELNKLKDAFEKKESQVKQGIALPESRATIERNYQNKLKDFQRFVKDAQEDMQKLEEELGRKVFEGMEKIISEYGKKNGYTFIFVRNELMLYADDKSDLTAEVLSIFNSSRKK